MIAQRQGTEQSLGPKRIWSLLLELRRTARTLSRVPNRFGLGLDAGQPAILSADDPATWEAVDGISDTVAQTVYDFFNPGG